MLSVIVCTHNPRLEYLERVLAALRGQSLPVAESELLLIDNASETPLSSQADLSWHPRSFHIREERLGLTHARLRGIAESSGDILVFVDDDNVLDLDYLEQVEHIGEAWPAIGAWSGQLVAEFEVEPPAWAKPYVHMVGIRQLDQDKWSNLPMFLETAPWGAGMCLRRSTAVAWADQLGEANPLRVALDPKGTELLRCGDLDMALTAADIGLGTGVFTALRLTHLIPAGRLELNYLLALQEGNGYSHEVLFAVRGRLPAVESRWSRTQGHLRTLRQRDSVRRKFRSAGERGRQRARADIRRVMSAPA